MPVNVASSHRIPLGNTGILALGSAPQPWQLVGCQERFDMPDAHAEDSEEETTFWREYLLYNHTQGFAFLIDSTDGWSCAKPISGAPTARGEQVHWQSASYKKRWACVAKVTWVQGEFYWRVQREERALVTDFEGQGGDSDKRLSREQTGNEVTWSVGLTLNAGDLADAFGIAAGSRAALQRDVRRTFGAASTEYPQCQRSSGSGCRGRGGGTGRGSYGGYSSGGGGHK